MGNISVKEAIDKGYKALCILGCPGGDWEGKIGADIPFVKGQIYDVKFISDFVDRKNETTKNLDWWLNPDGDYFMNNYEEVADLGLTQEQVNWSLELMFAEKIDDSIYYSPAFFIYLPNETELNKVFLEAKKLNNKDLYELYEMIRGLMVERFRNS